MVIFFLNEREGAKLPFSGRGNQAELSRSLKQSRGARCEKLLPWLSSLQCCRSSPLATVGRAWTFVEHPSCRNVCAERGMDLDRPCLRSIPLCPVGIWTFRHTPVCVQSSVALRVCVCRRRGRESLLIAVCLEPSNGNTGARSADVRSHLPCPCSFPGNAPCSCWQSETSLGLLLYTLPVQITFPLISSDLVFLFKNTPPSPLVAVKVREACQCLPLRCFPRVLTLAGSRVCVWGHPDGCCVPCSCD